jgi:hypothetical protein
MSSEKKSGDGIIIAFRIFGGKLVFFLKIFTFSAVWEKLFLKNAIKNNY